MPTPGGLPWDSWEDAEEYYKKFPRLQCQPIHAGGECCATQLKGFEGDDGRPCPFCAQRDRTTNAIMDYRGSWVKLPLEVVAPEVFDEQGEPIMRKKQGLYIEV